MKRKILILSILFSSILPSCGFDKLLKKIDEQKKNTQTTIQNNNPNNNLNSISQNLNNTAQNNLAQNIVDTPKPQENSRETINQIINCYNKTQPAIAVTEHDYYNTVQSSQNLCKYSRKVPTSMELTMQLSSISSHLGDGFGGYNGKKAVEICKKSLGLAEANPASFATVINFLKPYVETLESVVTDLDQAKNYYSQQNYKDDACAQGKKLFDTILGKLDAMRGKEIAIALEMDKIKRNLDLSELAEMEKRVRKEIRMVLYEFHYSSRESFKDFAFGTKWKIFCSRISTKFS